MLDRDEDMVFCGQRHSFLGKYKIGFTEDGLIKAADVQVIDSIDIETPIVLSCFQMQVTRLTYR